MPDHVAAKVGEALNSVGKPIRGSKILVLGLAYKADVDDDRESPSYVLIEKLEALGAKVEYHDPYIPIIGKTREHDSLEGKKSVFPDASFDLFLIVTAHKEFKKYQFLDWNIPVVDTRNCINKNCRPRDYFAA
jgi:UDP-N-acetyl-D-glucosamine dehydrogenase